MHFFVNAVKDSLRQETVRGGSSGNVLQGIFYRPSATSPRPPHDSPTDRRAPSPSLVKQGIKRAATIVGRKKGNSLSDDRSSLSRTSSLFYHDHDQGVDVTTIFIRPDREFSKIEFDGKSAAEVLEMLKEEVSEMNNMIMPVSTGSGTVNMTVGCCCY